jgi:very-short-patch-repair endonuclease
MSRSNRISKKTEPARRLLREATSVERRLWERLRDGRLGGAEFRRQHPASHYVMDFYCPAVALAIEIDGGQRAETGKYDRQRDRWLTKHGVTILRFRSTDVIESIDGVVEYIAEKIGELGAAARPRPRRSTGLTPAPTLPPSGGGGAPPALRRRRTASGAPPGEAT